MKDIQKRNQSMMLKSILMRPDIEVIYSHVILDEINQIIGNTSSYIKLDKEKQTSRDMYFIEHFAVLKQLKAKYIEPSSRKLITGEPHKIALKYAKNVTALTNTPYEHFAKNMDKFIRKISGLPINENLENLGADMILNIGNIINITIEQLNNMNENDFDEPMKSLMVKMKENIPKLLKKSMPISNPFANTDNTPLGVKPFREHEPNKKLMESQPSQSKLVMELKSSLEKDKPMASLNSFVNKSIENKIFYAYTQLNWLGYYADDFDKQKKGKDRFNSSQNDMKHASYAHIANFLISNDEKFLKKTIVSYEFANVKTIVCAPEIFLKEHFFKKNNAPENESPLLTKKSIANCNI